MVVVLLLCILGVLLLFAFFAILNAIMEALAVAAVVSILIGKLLYTAKRGWPFYASVCVVGLIAIALWER